MKKKVGKFTFVRPTAPRIPRNERIRRKSTSGVLTEKELETFITNARNRGWPIKYSKPIGFRKRKK
jgi:hypothetical protein